MSIFLGLGTNLGNRKNNLNKSISLLNNSEKLNILRKSKIYETSPMENLEQGYFLNQIVKIEFSGTLDDLFLHTQKVERKMGKLIQKIRYKPRIIDIDILSFNDIVVNTEKLSVPHPKIKFRKFVLKPWTDIDSNYILPNSKMTIKEHLDNISDLIDEVREYK